MRVCSKSSVNQPAVLLCKVGWETWKGRDDGGVICAWLLNIFESGFQQIGTIITNCKITSYNNNCFTETVLLEKGVYFLPKFCYFCLLIHKPV